MASSLHVIFGTGPVGCWIARALREQQLRVRAVNRSGVRPDLMPADVEMVKANAADPAQALAAAKGASTIYQALAPPYHLWERLFPPLQAAVLNAARSANARYVSIENLYMYDSSKPIAEDSPLAPVSRKGALRLQMAEEVAAALSRGEVRTTTLRSSDYYGPGVLGSALGERVFGRLVAGKGAQIQGSAVQPHSFAYIEDVGRAAAALGANDAALGRVWLAPHAPAWTQERMVAEACRALGIEGRLRVVSPFMMRLAGLFVPEARASVEMMYEFVKPFVVESTRSERELGISHTPIPVGIDRTVRWYKERAARRSPDPATRT